jgi:hypothetical protein
MNTLTASLAGKNQSESFRHDTSEPIVRTITMPIIRSAQIAHDPDDPAMHNTFQ